MDLDGTLTTSQRVISPRTRDTLLRAQEQGVRLILASGRPRQGMEFLASELRMQDYGGYLLCYNGGLVVKCDTGEVLYQRTLYKEYLPMLFHRALAAGHDALVYHDDGILTTNATNQHVLLSGARNHLQVHQAVDFLSEVRHPVNKLLIVGNPETLPVLEQELRQELRGRVDVFRSEPFYLECVSPGINKGDCLSVITDDAGCSMQDLLAFGDGDNDISMLQQAGHGVAMGNAWSSVKDYADEVTLSNDEDGVAIVVERMLCGV